MCASQGVALANNDGRQGKSDPFLRFLAKPKNMQPDGKHLKLSKHGELLVVHETEVIDNELNPAWKPFQVDMDKLCRSSLGTKFMIECWDKDTETEDDLIGWIETTVGQLLTRRPLVLRRPDRPGANPPKPGTLAIDSIDIAGGREGAGGVEVWGGGFCGGFDN